MNTRTGSMKRMMMTALAVVVVLQALAEAQSPAGKLTDNCLGNRSEFRFDLSRFPVYMRPVE